MGKGVGPGSQEAVTLGRQYAFRFFQEYFHCSVFSPSPIREVSAQRGRGQAIAPTMDHENILLTPGAFQHYTFTMIPIDIPIVYQDHYLIIVNKPAGLVIH